jgi:hypothetical protein
MSVIATDQSTREARSSRVRDARVTGLLYLGLAVTGLLGFVVVRALWIDPVDPAVTFGNLIEQSAMARVGLALELGIVITQALAALAFFRLFRSVDTFRAGALAAFGLVNATVILASTAVLATAIEVADGTGGASAADASATVAILLSVSANLWLVGGLFFGLWLIPMGLLALESRWMPRALGWVLVIGGVGYIASTFAQTLLPGASTVADLLTLPATVGELWMIGYLLVRGVARTAQPVDGLPHD